MPFISLTRQVKACFVMCNHRGYSDTHYPLKVQVETVKEFTRSVAIIQSLIEHGVTNIFGMLGAQTDAFFDALSRHSHDIQLIGSPRGQGAASAWKFFQPAGYGL